MQCNLNAAKGLVDLLHDFEHHWNNDTSCCCVASPAQSFTPVDKLCAHLESLMEDPERLVLAHVGAHLHPYREVLLGRRPANQPQQSHDQSLRG